jgi:hypothetical protein
VISEATHSRAHAKLDALADGPVSVIDQMPELDRIVSIEIKVWPFRQDEVENHRPPVNAPDGPQQECSGACRGQAEQEVGIDQLALGADVFLPRLAWGNGTRLVYQSR